MLRVLAAWVRRTPLALPLLGLIGVLAPLLGASLWMVTWAGISLLIALMLREWRVALATLLVAAVGFFHLHGSLRSEDAARAALLSQSGVELQGTIVRESTFSRLLKIKGSPARVELRGQHLCGGLGSEIALRGVVREITEDYLPGCFDRAAWLRSQGVVAQVDVLEMRVLEPSWNWWRVCALSEHYRAKLSRIFMPDGTESDARRQVLCALLLGERSLAAPETLQVFQWSGALHAFAVSGLHVGLIAGMLWFVLSRLRVPPHGVLICVLILLAGYVFLTGMAVPSQRAYGMIALFIMGRLLRRQVFVGNLIAAVALVILLLDPRQLVQAGFLLSFIVYMGIGIGIYWARDDEAWFGPDPYIPRLIYTSWERGLVSMEFSMRSILIVAVSASLVSLPLTAYFFSSFSQYGTLTNICITPILPIVMGLGLLMLLCSWVPLLSGVSSYLALQSSGLLLAVCSFFAGLPSALVATVPPSQAHDYSVIGLPYGQQAVLLGNPAVLIHQVNASTAQWTLCPAIKGAGFQVKLIIEPARSTAAASSQWMKGIWPDVQLYPCRATEVVQEYQIGENTIRVYPAPCLMKRPLADDKLPIIHWHSPKGSLLYIGNASAATYDYWKSRGVSLRAHAAILGHNRKQPFLDEEELRSIGVKQVIKLQDVREGELIHNQLRN
ncbi:MAG: ComEC/Rec2 family competence protein [Akkermansia sp.]